MHRKVLREKNPDKIFAKAKILRLEDIWMVCNQTLNYIYFSLSLLKNNLKNLEVKIAPRDEKNNIKIKITKTDLIFSPNPYFLKINDVSGYYLDKKRIDLPLIGSYKHHSCHVSIVAPKVGKRNRNINRFKVCSAIN